MQGLRGLALLLLFQAIGELLSRGFSLPLPGPVLGLVLLLVALRFAAVREPVGVAPSSCSRTCRCCSCRSASASSRTCAGVGRYGGALLW